MSRMTDRIHQLREFDSSQTGLAMAILKANEGNFYTLDMLFLAAINRSRSNISAFLQLLESQNYLAAIPFIRMQLDGVLRLYALRLVDDPSNLSQRILEGESLKRIRDRNGNKMSDAYLCEQVAAFEPWITQVYKSCSGFVHLSNKHIFSLFSEVGERGNFQIAIGPKQLHISDDLKEEAVAGMLHITSLMVGFCEDWLKQKACSSSNRET